MQDLRRPAAKCKTDIRFLPDGSRFQVSTIGRTHMAKYSIGLDFGTLSGRALLVDIETGREVATSVFNYPHGVMDEALPDGARLGVDWALQHPQDYLDVLAAVIPEVLEKSGVSPDDIIGIGVDFTACTMMPVKKDGTPLCFLEEFVRTPNAYVKLWKHHAAQDKATRLNAVAEQTGQEWLPLYGGKISSEWLFPKLWQVLDESPEVYGAMDDFIEAGDWLVWQLTGVKARNACAAGCKAMWHKRRGYPDESFFAALDPRLRDVVSTKLNGPVVPLGSRAGGLTAEMAKLTGLVEGTAMAACNVDAHVCVPALKIDGPGKMMIIMGTSSCHMLLGSEEIVVPGICGCVEDGILPGYYGYEAGQTCVGDHFAWFTENCVSAACREKAKAAGKDIHAYLQEKMMDEKPGESGLLALDWWNGNRSVLVDVDLTGLVIGMTLQTRPEQIYRALVEATAFGTRKIIETFRSNGVAVNEIIAAGGIAEKSPAIMQIYADVVKMPIRISGSAQGPALGAAIFGAVAGGGYDSVFAAANRMGKLRDTVYVPISENAAVYDQLYAEYELLHKYFGEGGNNVMKRLKALKKGQ
jgi:L-ribulokinase